MTILIIILAAISVFMALKINKQLSILEKEIKELDRAVEELEDLLNI